MSQSRYTRSARRAKLELINSSTPSVPAKISSNVTHDERGNALWVGELTTLEDASSLTLSGEAAPVSEDDPYNRPARPTALKARSR